MSYARTTRTMPENWEQVKELFTLALERDPTGTKRISAPGLRRGRLFARRNRIAALQFRWRPYLSRRFSALNLLSAQSPALAGKRIGAYRILREIGRGGMAVVYLAERADEQFRKRVAIKMLHPGTNKDEILRRFRNERKPWRLWTTPVSCACWTVGAPKKVCPI